jgi:hypothetical protein
VSAGICLVALAHGVRADSAHVVPPLTAQSSNTAGTAAITGTVLDAITARPVAGVTVTLEERAPGQPGKSFVQVSTPSGRFAFVDLPASESYFLTASRSGYLDGGYGRPDPRGPSAPLALANGEWRRDVRITLARPGSITGTITDERGEPVVGVPVRVLPQVLVSGRAQWLAGATALTDDRGVYRLAGLGPGKYLVAVPTVQATLPASAAVRLPGSRAGTSMSDIRSAVEADRAEKLLVDLGGGQQLVVGRYNAPPLPSPEGRRMAYPIVFHPNVSMPAEALPIDLRVSEDRVGVDIRLMPVSTARVSGIVQGPPGAIGNLLLRLIPVGLEDLGQGSEAATTVTLADGRFSFFDVPTGSYVLETRHSMLELTHTSMREVATALPAPVPFPAIHAAAGSVSAASPGVSYSSLYDGAEQAYWGQRRVDVSAPDVHDVVLALRRLVTMTGRFEWAPGAEPLARVPPLLLEPADGRRSLGLPSVIGLGSASTFTIDSIMAGEYMLRIRAPGIVQAISWEGRDYTDRPFDTTEGRDITGVVVTLTNASSSITGIVSDAGAALTSGAAVIAFPVERERWSNYGLNPVRFKSVLTTVDGKYRLDGLPAGEYYLIAVPQQQERAWVDPAFLAARASRATRVRIERTDAAISNVTLSLVR